MFDMTNIAAHAPIISSATKLMRAARIGMTSLAGSLSDSLLSNISMKTVEFADSVSLVTFAAWALGVSTVAAMVCWHQHMTSSVGHFNQLRLRSCLM